MSGAATARMFFALDLPREVGAALGEWARRAAGAERARPTPLELRLLDPDTLHITLCFLGTRPLEEVDWLAGALEAAAGASYELSLGAPLLLPPRDPRSLAVEIHDAGGELASMQRRLSGSLCELCDWEPERRRFRAHVTVARVRRHGPRGPRGGRESRRRGGAPGGEAGGGVMLPATPSLAFAPAAITLYRSFLLPSGAVYEALASSSLAPA